MDLPPLQELPDLPRAEPRPIIDAHTHAWAAEPYAAIIRWFDRHGWPVRDRLDGDEAASTLMAHGVTRWVALAYAHRPGVATSINDWLAGYAGRQPRAIVFAAVHPEDDVRRVLGRAIDAQGLRGVKLHCHVMGIAPDDPRCFPIYDFLCERGLPLVIHAGTAPESDAYPRPCREITGVAHIAGMMRRFPTMSCCVPHLAMDDAEEVGALLEAYPNLMLDTAMALARYFPTRPSSAWLLRHQKRIMYGTDFPIIPYAYEREWRCILELGLGRAFEDDVFYNNAVRFFRVREETSPRG